MPASHVADVLNPRDLIPFRSPELKHLDVTSAAGYLGITYNGLITHLSAISQGGAGNQRIGDSVTIRAIDFRMNGYVQGSATGMRIILFQWNRDTLAAVPVPADVLQSAGVGSDQAVIVPYNSDNSEQGTLNILVDEFIPCGASPSVFKFAFRKAVRLPCTFDAGQLTGMGTLRVLTISDAALATNSPAFHWWSRIFYEDV